MAKLSCDLQSEINFFVKEQPRFCLCCINPGYQLDGYYLVNRKHNGFIVYLAFEVQIIVPFRFPAILPSVFFDKRLIPGGFDHINSNGSLCLSTRTSQLDFLSVNCCLIDYFDLFLANYLFSMEYFRKYSVFPFGEWPHGREGELEYLDTQKDFMKTVRKYAFKKN